VTKTVVPSEIEELNVMTKSSSKYFVPLRFLLIIFSCRIAHTMITRHPFNTWPLHVKLFTEEAVKFWEVASIAKDASAMPPGFTCSIELEGVDGKSGHVGSGRNGPIDIEDGHTLDLCEI